MPDGMVVVIVGSVGEATSGVGSGVGAVVSGVVTTTRSSSSVVPAVLVQARVYVVLLVGVTDSEPLVDFEPDQPPRAVQLDAPVVFQVRVDDCPGVRSLFDAVRVTVGLDTVAPGVVGGVMVIVVDLVSEPPVPVQARVYVVVTVGVTDWVPLMLFDPDQPPLAVQLDAPVLLQVRDDCVLVRLRVGADAVTGGGVLVTVTFVLQVAV